MGGARARVCWGLSCASAPVVKHVCVCVCVGVVLSLFQFVSFCASVYLCLFVTAKVREHCAWCVVLGSPPPRMLLSPSRSLLRWTPVAASARTRPLARRVLAMVITQSTALTCCTVQCRICRAMLWVHQRASTWRGQVGGSTLRECRLATMAE